MRNQKLSKLRRIVNIILFVIFSLFAFVQLNDPDSIVWFILYAITAFINCFYLFICELQIHFQTFFNSFYNWIIGIC